LLEFDSKTTGLAMASPARSQANNWSRSSVLLGAATNRVDVSAAARTVAITIMARRGNISASRSDKGGNDQSKENEWAAGHGAISEGVRFRGCFLGGKQLHGILGSRSEA
jgi:hypothetical protein